MGHHKSHSRHSLQNTLEIVNFWVQITFNIAERECDLRAPQVIIVIVDMASDKHLQGCRGYEISHPYPYPYPQISVDIHGYPYPWISMDIHIHSPQTYPLYRLYVSTNIHKGHSSESTVGILVFCTSI